MKLPPRLRSTLAIQVGPARLSLAPLWIVILPGILWGLAEWVMPLSAPMLTPPATWGAALAATLALLLALLGHALGHALVAELVGAPLPERIPIEPFGDPAQVWPAAPTPVRDALVALGGPLASALQATLWAAIWNLQLHPAANAVAFLATLVNGSLAIANLLPGFPLDGGRVLRSLIWGDLALPARAVSTARATGAVLLLALAGWGAYLLALGARFSLETGAATLAVALIMLAGQRHPAWRWQAPPPAPPRSWPGWIVATLAPAAQLCATLLAVPLVDGLYAPGPAVSVQPMVRVPDERRTSAAGELMLTTVVAQTPITLGQWAYAQFEPAFTLVPPERVVPRDTTPQQIMRYNVQMLEESEATAMVVGTRMAGFSADLTSTALAITAVSPESPAAALLQAGDAIIAADGVPTPRVELLRAALVERKPGDSVTLTVERAGQAIPIAVTLIEPGEPGGPPRIGVTLQPIGLDVDLPFPITIETRKIAGGPSAGLMFTLAIYDLLAPEDLTHGWRIAGTGTITLDGAVGPIGGIAQKVAGAEWAGADYFIVPREHEAEARRAARDITLIPVSTAQEAIDALRALPTR